MRKRVYPYEHIDSREKFDETSLPNKKDLEDITDKDYEHAQKVWEVFQIKNVGE